MLYAMRAISFSLPRGGSIEKRHEAPVTVVSSRREDLPAGPRAEWPPPSRFRSTGARRRRGSALSTTL